MPQRVPCGRVKEEVNAGSADEQGHGDDNIHGIVERRVPDGAKDNEGQVDAHDHNLIRSAVVIAFHAVRFGAPNDQANMQGCGMEEASVQGKEGHQGQKQEPRVADIQMFPCKLVEVEAGVKGLACVVEQSDIFALPHMQGL